MNAALAGMEGVLTALRGRKRFLFAAHSSPAYVICLVGATILACAVASGRFDYDRALFAAAVESVCFVLSCAFAARWIGFSKIADPVEQIMLLLFSALILAFCSVVSASAGAPLADDMLRSLDLAAFGVDRSRLIDELTLSRRSLPFWAWVYNSLAYTPMVAVTALALAGRADCAWAMVTALLGAASVSITFVAVLPAHGVPPFPYAFTAVLDGVRGGSLRTFDNSVVTGIVTFPSMHAADAVILMGAFGWLGWWAWPFVALNALMFASALVVGGHYLIDLVAGGAIGWGALHVSLRVHRAIGVANASSPRSAS